MIDRLPDGLLDNLCRMALAEDVGPGDATTLAIVPENLPITAFFTTRENCVCCGMPVVKKLYQILDKYVEVSCLVGEGEFCVEGTRLATVHGNARAIITGERIALNFLQHLSGIATTTSRYVEALGNSKTRLLDTRKTIPGMRILEKYAVAKGGGQNHRIGLFDMVMIKDNHRTLANFLGNDGIAEAVKACRAKYPKLKVEVEADTLEDVEAAVKAKADIVMFDNMPNEMMRKALRITEGKCKTEASGGITLERLPSMANLGLDYISVGALTHSVKAIDIGLDM